MYSSCSIRMRVIAFRSCSIGGVVAVLFRRCSLAVIFGRALCLWSSAVPFPGERETLSPGRIYRIDPGAGPEVRSWFMGLSNSRKGGGAAMRDRVNDLRELTRRRHVDLVRVSSALCRP
ncbi:putative leader peptide [Streptomyces sp. NPDC012623]|uniref:putative leader peptide n=1 Tax=unclassified Streptomyces TaxID=2593676 RepID=UPI003693532B